MNAEKILYLKIWVEDLAINVKRIMKLMLSKYCYSVSSRLRWLMIDTKERDL